MGKALIGNKIEAPKDVRPHDVICGRGTSFLTKVLPGNKSYRKMIERRMDDYEESEMKEKRKVNEAIVDLVVKRGGRFLEYETKRRKWLDIGYERAVAKTAQGFRDYRNSPTYIAAKKASSSSSSSKATTVTPKKVPVVRAHEVEEEKKEEPTPPPQTPDVSNNDTNTSIEATDGNHNEDDDAVDDESESEEIKPFTGPLTFPIITPRRSGQAYNTVSPPSTRPSRSPSPSVSSLAGGTSITTTITGENNSAVLADGEDVSMKSQKPQKRRKLDGFMEPPLMAYNFDYFPTTTPGHVIEAATSPMNDSRTNGEREMFWYWKLK